MQGTSRRRNCLLCRCWMFSWWWTFQLFGHATVSSRGSTFQICRLWIILIIWYKIMLKVSLANNKKMIFFLIGEYSNIVVHQKKPKSAWHHFIQQHFWHSSAYEIQHKCSIKSYYSWIWLKLSKSLALGNAACTSHCGRKTCSFVIGIRLNTFQRKWSTCYIFCLQYGTSS